MPSGLEALPKGIAFWPQHVAFRLVDFALWLHILSSGLEASPSGLEALPFGLSMLPFSVEILPLGPLKLPSGLDAWLSGSLKLPFWHQLLQCHIRDCTGSVASSKKWVRSCFECANPHCHRQTFWQQHSAATVQRTVSFVPVFSCSQRKRSKRWFVSSNHLGNAGRHSGSSTAQQPMMRRKPLHSAAARKPPCAMCSSERFPDSYLLRYVFIIVEPIFIGQYMSIKLSA